MANTPNWKHNSGKDKRGRGTCKGRLKARRQSLQHLKNRQIKNCNKDPNKGPFSVMIHR